MWRFLLRPGAAGLKLRAVCVIQVGDAAILLFLDRRRSATSSSACPDGLTVPFALATGLAGAVSSHVLIVIGGMAEIAAGSIAMGMGGYLAARSDADSYQAELRREEQEVDEVPDVEREEVRDIFAAYGLQGQPLALVVSAVVTIIALGIFGWVKGRFTGVRPLRSAGQTVLVGGLAAGAAYIIARIISRVGA